MFNITGYDKVADRNGFVVAYPDDEGALPWNVGRGVCGAGAAVSAPGDDQGFMEALIADIETDRCLDHDHIFMSGFSMGGYFANETGCINPTFRAVGPHSGGSHELTNCESAHRPVILFHGTSDSLMIVTA